MSENFKYFVVIVLILLLLSTIVPNLIRQARAIQAQLATSQ